MHNWTVTTTDGNTFDVYADAVDLNASTTTGSGATFTTGFVVFRDDTDVPVAAFPMDRVTAVRRHVPEPALA